MARLTNVLAGLRFSRKGNRCLTVCRRDARSVFLHRARHIAALALLRIEPNAAADCSERSGRECAGWEATPDICSRAQPSSVVDAAIPPGQKGHEVARRSSTAHVSSSSSGSRGIRPKVNPNRSIENGAISIRSKLSPSNSPNLWSRRATRFS